MLTGGDARYTGSRLVTRLKAAGIELAAMGETGLGDDEAEVVRFADPARGTYKKVVIRGDRLVGAILLGETGTAGPTGSRYGHAPGHSCIAVLGPVERAITIETGSPDRVANMRAFTVAALDLLEKNLG